MMVALGTSTISAKARARRRSVDSQDNLAIVQRTYEAVGQGDIPGLLGLVSDDVEWTLQGPESIPFASTRHGPDGVAEC
jgi:ketosteroid isomerase-like protein